MCGTVVVSRVSCHSMSTPSPLYSNPLAFGPPFRVARQARASSGGGAPGGPPRHVVPGPSAEAGTAVGATGRPQSERAGRGWADDVGRLSDPGGRRGVGGGGGGGGVSAARRPSRQDGLLRPGSDVGGPGRADE